MNHITQRRWWRNWTPKISYPKVGGSIFDELGRAIHNNVFLGLTVDFLPKHFCLEYRNRLDAAKEDLQKLNLEALYHDPELVGKLFEEA
jgi:hypothetical protein